MTAQQNLDGLPISEGIKRLWAYEFGELKGLFWLPASLPRRLALNTSVGLMPAIALWPLAFVLARRSALASQKVLQEPARSGAAGRALVCLTLPTVPGWWPSGLSAIWRWFR